MHEERQGPCCKCSARREARQLGPVPQSRPHQWSWTQETLLLRNFADGEPCARGRPLSIGLPGTFQAALLQLEPQAVDAQSTATKSLGSVKEALQQKLLVLSSLRQAIRTKLTSARYGSSMARHSGLPPVWNGNPSDRTMACAGGLLQTWKQVQVTKRLSAASRRQSYVRERSAWSKSHTHVTRCAHTSAAPMSRL